jgi:hypothetical protein
MIISHEETDALAFSHVQVWDLVENKHLFDGRDEEGEHNNRFHISEMVAYIGVPPVEFQKRSEHAHRVFNEDGTSRPFSWKSPVANIADLFNPRHLEGQPACSTPVA